MKKLVSLVLALTMVLSIFTVVPFSASADTGNTVYLINSANWSNVHAYTWTTGGGESAAWPGNLMTNTGQKSSNGADIYSITVDSAYDNIIFNCGNDSAKTADLKTQFGGYFDNSSMSWVNDNPTPNPNPTPGGMMTIYFQNNWMWTDVKVYYWGSSSTNSATWPGDTPQLAGNDGTYDVYSATVPTDITGIIFNGFDGGINTTNQTPDILTAADGDCYSMEWNAAENKNNVVRSDINNILPINPTDAPTDAPTEAPTAAPTQAPTVEPTEAPVDGLFVRIDGKTYEVKKGDVVNYTYKLSVADVKISSLDIEMNYDNDGLQFMPYTDEYGEVDLVKQFPVINGGVVQNYDYADADGIIYYNFSSVAGLRFNDSIMFTGQFKVTADKGIYDISSKVNTMADSDLNKIVYNFEKYGDYTEAEVVGDLQPIEPTDAPTQAPQTQAPQTQAPQTQAPQPTQNPEDEGLYVKADGKYYPVVKGQTYTYQYCLSVDPSIKISSLDINMNFDIDGLKFVPYTDEYGDVDLNKHFPKISGGVVQNYTMADTQGLIFYNYSNVAGIRMADNTVIFTGDFTVTADKGTYEIVSKVNTMADSNLNKIVYNFEVFGEYGESASVLDVEPVTPTNAPQPTQAPTQAPTTAPQPTQEPDKGLFVRVDGQLYEVEKGQKFTYQYCLSVDEAIKISSLDVRTMFDQEGLKFNPYTDEYGDNDLAKQYPKINGGVVCNYNFAETEGILYYNYSNVAGIRMANDTVIFVGEFEVTADEGIYNLSSIVNTMADSDGNKLVYEGDVFSEYGDKEIVDLKPYEPTEKPTEEPTTPPVDPTYPEGLFVEIDRTLYEVEKDKEYTFTYYFQLEGKRVGSLDARVEYDTEGLDLIPTLDEDGYEDTLKMFPILMSPTYNFEHDGKIYINDTKIPNGVNFPSQTSVLFTVKFKVTADEGVYEINPYIYNLADTQLNKIVNEGYVIGEYYDKGVLDAPIYDGNDNPDILMGDVNLDGEVSVFDVSEIQRYAAAYCDLNELQLTVGDVNYDGIVNVFDASEIQRYIAGFITEFVKPNA